MGDLEGTLADTETAWAEEIDYYRWASASSHCQGGMALDQEEGCAVVEVAECKEARRERQTFRNRRSRFH